MDGTRPDRRINGRLDRPATMEIIVRDYPDIIIGLISGLCSVSYILASGPNGARNISVTYGQKYIIREEDFEVCQRIARLFDQSSSPGRVSAFLSEPPSDFRNRIAAYLQLEFNGRV